MIIYFLKIIKEEAVANWSKWNFPLTLKAIDDIFYYSIDLLMNPQAQLNLRSSCGSWVMMQIVSKSKSLIKRQISQQVSFIKLL